MDRTLLLWTLVLFFGASLVFRFVGDATSEETLAVRLGAQVAALVAIVTAVVVYVRRRG